MRGVLLFCCGSLKLIYVVLGIAVVRKSRPYCKNAGLQLCQVQEVQLVQVQSRIARPQRAEKEQMFLPDISNRATLVSHDLNTVADEDERSGTCARAAS